MMKSHISYYAALIALLVVMNAAMAFGQSHDASTANAEVCAGMIVAINDRSEGDNRFAKSEYRHQENVNEQRPSTNGLMVAEDMRCRGCRGKCKADNLRCRSQCVGDDTCLAQCEERSSKCETLCKQLFQCQ